MPEIRRLNYTAHAERAAPTNPDDPGYAGAIAHEAVRLAPLQKIQVAFDQAVVRVEALARGEPWPYTGGGFRDHAAATLDHARRQRDVLRCAADAADSLINEFSDTLSSVQEPTMSGANPNEGPQLTVGGEPHPLQEGGYDAQVDAQRPAMESDVAALKAGHTSQAEAEALARADVAGPADAEPAPADTQAEARMEDEGAPPAAAPAATDFAATDDDPAPGPGAYSPEPKRGRRK